MSIITEMSRENRASSHTDNQSNKMLLREVEGLCARARQLPGLTEYMHDSTHTPPNHYIEIF